MREKLIDLLYEAEGLVNNELPTIEMVADHLIANGVTVNPCKVGDTVYALYSRHEYKKRNGSIYRQNAQILTYSHLKFAMDCGAVEIREKKCTKTDSNLIGKTVFATKEDAEKTISGGKERQ